MDIALLGPLEVAVGSQPRPIAGGRLRSLLSRLAVAEGRVVSTAELVEAVWPDDPPSGAANALQSLVSRLRRALADPEAVSQAATGYRLAISPTELDAARFAELVRDAEQQAGSGQPQEAIAGFDAALRLWRGEPLADAGDAEYAIGYRTTWERLRLRAEEERLTSLLTAGRIGDAVSTAEALAVDHPLNERIIASRLRALAAAGRVPEALANYEETRQFLRRELGTEPGAELRALHLRLLRGELGPAPDTVPSPPARRSNLRAPLTSFVGREDDLSRVLDLVTAHRLTTVIGPGGAGKTRLAIEAARRWLAVQPDSAWLVELAPVTDPDNLAATVLGALGLRDARVTERAERSAQGAHERLLDRLREARCLLVMDNCEHVLDAVAQLIDDILAAAPGVVVLATSRELLGLTGEALCALPPLPLPAADVPLSDAVSYPAVELWLDRATTVRPAFALDPETLGPVIEIVRRLDGLPLAIELAAARLRLLPVTEIAARLSDRFRLLTGGNRTSLPRHRTLRAVVEWSWDLLAPDERLLAERLAVFPAGADLDSAATVCADARLPAGEIESLLASLVDKSLLQAELPEATGATGVRYRMLETIREYGVERLAERDELADVRLAHAEHYAASAIGWEPMLRGRDQLIALTSLSMDRDNVLAALRYLGDSGRGEEALQLLLALTWYWTLLDARTEFADWAAFVLAANDGKDLPDLVYARAARLLSDLGERTATQRPNWDRVRQRLGALAEELATAGPPPFPSLGVLRPMVAAFAGELDLADVLLAEAGRSDDPWLRAASQATAANLYENSGEIERMRAAVDLAYPAFVALGDRWGLSTCLMARAQLATLDGRLADALADYLQARRCIRELGSVEDELFLHLQIADVYVRSGDIPAARAELDELATSGPLGPHPERQLFTTASLAVLELQVGRHDQARLLVAELRRALSERHESTVMLDHVQGIGLAAAAVVECLTDDGDLEQAAADLREGYPAAMQTMDGPIISAIGVAQGAWLAATGRSREAAIVLGAATTVRGAEDRSNWTAALIRQRLQVALGEQFWSLYQQGQALARVEALQHLDPLRHLDPVRSPGPDEPQARFR